MKKIILLLFFCFTSIFANIYDTKTIIEDFKTGNVDKYNKDNIPLIDKQQAKIKYLLAMGPGSYIVQVQSPSASGNNVLEVFKCPKGTELYSTTVYSVDFKNLSMQCMVARKNQLEKPIALFNWHLSDYGDEVEFSAAVPNFKKWEEYFSKDLAAAAAANEELLNSSKAQFAGLIQAKNEAKESQEAAGANIGIPKIILGTLLGDTGLIDVQSSINHSAIVLNEGNTVAGGNFLKTKTAMTVNSSDATFGEVWRVDPDTVGGVVPWMQNVWNKVSVGDKPVVALKVQQTAYQYQDKSSDVITSRLVNLLEFYPKFSQLNQDLYMLLLGIFGIAGISMISAARASQFFEHDEQGKNKIIMWGGGVVLTAIAFFPTDTQLVSIDGKEFQASQNNFTKFEVMGYYTAVDFANGIANIVIDNEMNSIARRAGAINTNTIIDVAASQQLNIKERSAVATALTYCANTYHIPYTQQYNGGGNFTFPKSEQYVYAQYIKKGLNPNIYSSINNNGLMLLDNPDKEYPKISLSACQKIEKKIDYLEKMSEKNKATLLAATDGVDERKIAMLEQLYHSQYGFLDEWGWLSIISLPTVTFKSENLEQLYLKQTDRATELLKKEDDGVLKDVVTSIPWYLIPGMSNIQNMFESQFSDISALAGPVGKIVGSVAGGLTGYYFAVQVAQNLVEILPILGIVMISLLIILKIIIKIFTYHLMAPFVMLLAFSKQNVQLVLNYVARVITIMFEIPIFVLSVYAAMSARDILLALGTPMSSAVLKIMSEITEAQNDSIVHNMLDYLAQGAIEVTLQIFAFIIIYKILSTYHTMIFEAIEAKTASALDDVVTSTQQSAVNYGQRL
jgi:hypothetical protein